MYLDKPIWSGSLGLKILYAYVFGVIVSIGLIITLIFWLMNHQNSFIAGADLSALADDLSKKMKFDSEGRPFQFDNYDDELMWIFQSIKHEAAYRVLDDSGNTIFTSSAGDAFWSANTFPVVPIQGYGEFLFNDQLIRGQTAPIHHGKNIWYIQVGISARFLNFMHQGTALPFMSLGIVLFSMVLLLVFSLCAYITLGYTLSPLRKVSESAAAISPGSLNSRLPIEQVPYEIAPLVESFNRVLDRLEHGYRTQQEFLATAAHELKTPLALIRAQLEMDFNENIRGYLLNDVAHMTRQVQQILHLAEVCERENYKSSDVNVSDLVDEVSLFLQPMAKSSRITIRRTSSSTVVWHADKSALFILLKNLVENAIQHAPTNSEVALTLSTSELTVRDWGPGINNNELPHIFDRFWRAGHRRDHGAGLGLAICQEIAEAHRWSLTAHQEEQGIIFRLKNICI